MRTLDELDAAWSAAAPPREFGTVRALCLREADGHHATPDSVEATIGGGLTGCTAAGVFAQAGHSVVLLEAGRLASGATAGGIGAIVPQPDAWWRSVEPVVEPPP